MDLLTGTRVKLPTDAEGLVPRTATPVIGEEAKIAITPQAVTAQPKATALTETAPVQAPVIDPDAAIDEDVIAKRAAPVVAVPEVAGQPATGGHPCGNATA